MLPIAAHAAAGELTPGGILDGKGMVVPLYGPPIFRPFDLGPMPVIAVPAAVVEPERGGVAADLPQTAQAKPEVKPEVKPEPAPAAEGKRGEPIGNGDYWLNYFYNIPRFFTAPTRFDTEDWIKTGAFVVVLGGAYLADESIHRFFKGHTNSFTDDLASIGYRLGDSKTIVAGAAAGYAAGYLLNDFRMRETSLLVLQSWALSAGASEGIKRLTGRERPNITDSHDNFDFLGGNGKSLPSGHATNAFSAATVIAEQYGDVVWVAPAAYGLASLVAWSRLNDNAHWTSDLVFGAGLGYAIGKVVTHFSPFREQTGMTAMPLPVSGQGGGMQLGFRF